MLCKKKSSLITLWWIDIEIIFLQFFQSRSFTFAKKILHIFSFFSFLSFYKLVRRTPLSTNHAQMDMGCKPSSYITTLNSPSHPNRHSPIHFIIHKDEHIETIKLCSSFRFLTTPQKLDGVFARTKLQKSGPLAPGTIIPRRKP